MKQQNSEEINNASGKKIYSYLGLAQKAGKLAAGEFSVEKAVKEKKAVLIIISEEASENTKKQFVNSGTFYERPVYFFGKKEELGAAIGKEFRASVAILDQGLADAIKKQLECLGHEDQRRR